MDLEPNGDEQQVIDAAADYLRGALPLERFRRNGEGRFTAQLRSDIAELGWFGMGLSEEAGGFGFSIVEEALSFREIGRHLGPNAVLGICLAARLAAEAGQTDLAQSLVAGSHGVAIAQADPNRPTMRLYDADGTDFAIDLSGTEARLLSLDGIPIRSRACLDRSITITDADLSDCAVAARAPVAATLRAARLFTAAMLVGICEATTDMINDYAKIRHTFGRPIGSYQAVRHPIADMATRTFATRQQLFLAAVSCRDGSADADIQVAAAKLLANEAALLNADANIQLHGGIATTDEHDAHYFMKRANVLARLFDDKALARELNSMAFAA